MGHPNCNYIATGSADCTVRLWDIKTGKCVRILDGLSHPVTATVVSPDGRSVVAGTSSGSIVSWCLDSTKMLGEITYDRTPIWSLAFAEGNPNLLVSGSQNGAMNLWDFSNQLNSGDKEINL